MTTPEGEAAGTLNKEAHAAWVEQSSAATAPPRVVVLADGELLGTAERTVDTSSLAPGVHRVRVEGESLSETRRVTVAR